jgi:uncharacterized membrane protein
MRGQSIRIAICICFIFSSSVFGASFQWLGSVPPDSLVGTRYLCINPNPEMPPADSIIAVGQGVYQDGALSDIRLGLEDDSLFARNNGIACKGYYYRRIVGGHTVTDLWGFEPILPPSGSYFDSAQSLSMSNAISADGSTVVGVISDGLGDLVSAFRWTQEEGMNIILPMEGSGTYNIANDVTGDGQIVVGFYIPVENWVYNDPAEQRQAFIWDAENGWQDLNAVLSGQYGIEPGGRLTDAIGISDDGMQIVGYGYNSQGNREGWLFTIPEPVTMVLLVFGGLTLRSNRKNLIC